jgi:hypothetical protein
VTVTLGDNVTDVPPAVNLTLGATLLRVGLLSVTIGLPFLLDP